MCYKVIIKKTVYVDADSLEEAEELALDGNDLFGVEEEVIGARPDYNARFYSRGRIFSELP